MTDLTNFAKERICTHFMYREPVSPPVQWYVALFLSETEDDGTGIEVSALGYVRQPVIFGPPTSAGLCRNTSEIIFPAAGENWGVVVHFALYDAETGGRMWFHGPLDNDVIVEESEMFSFQANSIAVSFE